MEDLDSLERNYENTGLEEPEIDNAEIYATHPEPEGLSNKVVPFPEDEKVWRRRYEALSEKVYSDRNLHEVVALYREQKPISKDGSIGIDDGILLPHHKGIIIDLSYVGYDLRRLHPNLYWCSKEQFKLSPLEKFPGEDGRSTRLLRMLKIEDLLELK